MSSFWIACLWRFSSRTVVATESAASIVAARENRSCLMCNAANPQINVNVTLAPRPNSAIVIGPSLGAALASRVPKADAGEGFSRLYAECRSAERFSERRSTRSQLSSGLT